MRGRRVVRSQDTGPKTSHHDGSLKIVVFVQDLDFASSLTLERLRVRSDTEVVGVIQSGTSYRDLVMSESR